jgi:Fe-S cluster biogenesis protein NfuA
MTPQDLLHRVESTLDELRPYLKADGGDIRLVEITPELVARIELLGACADCSMINMTLKGGVESALKKAAPELTAIEAINLQ